MAYLGSTQASTIANPPTQLITEIGAGPDAHVAGSTIFTANNYLQSSTNTSRPAGMNTGSGLWNYFTTDLSSSPFDSVSYFTDGGALGMRPGDVMMIRQHNSTVATSWYLRFAVVSHVTTAGVAFLSTQSLITCTT